MPFFFLLIQEPLNGRWASNAYKSYNMYLPPTRFSGDFSAQSEATAMKRVRAASGVHPSSDAAAYRDHGAMGGTEAEVASVGSMPQKSPTSRKAAFFHFRTCHRFGLPMIPPHLLKQQQ